MHNQQLSQRLQNAMKHTLESFQQRLKSNGLALHTLSPLQTLARGYAITKDSRGRIIRDSSDVQIGDKIITQLRHGQLTCAVEAINND